MNGRAGSIAGKVYDNGKVVGSSRVGAWSQEPDTEAKILGWGLDTTPPAATHVEALAPGTLQHHRQRQRASRGTSTTCDGRRLPDDHRGRRGARAAVPAPRGRPVAGDWDGDGDDEPGTFRGRHLAAPRRRRTSDRRRGPARSPTASRPATCRWSGDWDGDGVDDVGIFRDGARGTCAAPRRARPSRTVAYGGRPATVRWWATGTATASTTSGIYRSGGVVAPPPRPTAPRCRWSPTACRRATSRWWATGMATATTSRGSSARAGRGTCGRPTSPSAGTLRPFTYGAQVQDRPVAGDWTGAGASVVGDLPQRHVAPALEHHRLRLDVRHVPVRQLS